MARPGFRGGRKSSSSTKLRTVEELVNVTTCGRRFLQCGAQPATRTLGHDGFVGFDDVDVGSGFAQFAGDDVASDFGAHQQDTLSFDFALQAAYDGFGDIFFGNDVDLHPALLDRFLCGGADGGDAQAALSG